MHQIVAGMTYTLEIDVKVFKFMLAMIKDQEKNNTKRVKSKPKTTK